MAAALLIIDMQQGLCAGPYQAFEAEQLIARINLVTEKARKMELPVILVQHEESEGPFQRGTTDWQLANGLVSATTDIPLYKTACDAFHQTHLHHLLQELNISELIICGLQTEFCVDSTVRGALAHGYPVTLLADGHSTLNNGVLNAAQIIAHHNDTLSNLGSYGPRVQLQPCTTFCNQP